RAAERVLHPKKVFHCDVGRFNERHFTYVAAFGSFIDVSYKTPQNAKNMLGYLAYVLEAVQRLPNVQPHHAKFIIDDKELEGDYLLGMVANAASVAGFTIPGKEKVRLDDGVFEMMLVHYPHNLGEISEVSSGLLRGDFSSPLLSVERVRQVEVLSEKPCAWSLDGEYGGKTTHARIKVRHKAIGICI
ncbi:MAG: diacylglycerol kinase family protein, partial [Oscillospiraceae bacterium]